MLGPEKRLHGAHVHGHTLTARARARARDIVPLPCGRRAASCRFCHSPNGSTESSQAQEGGWTSETLSQEGSPLGRRNESRPPREAGLRPLAVGRPSTAAAQWPAGSSAPTLEPAVLEVRAAREGKGRSQHLCEHWQKLSGGSPGESTAVVCGTSAKSLARGLVQHPKKAKPSPPNSPFVTGRA